MSGAKWLELRYVTKVEIVPAAGKKGVIVSLEEDNEYLMWDNIKPYQIISQDRKLRLTDETVQFHYDYPDDFKKLVAFYHGDYQNAYDVYRALNRPVPEDWETCNKDGEYDYACC
jgi:hypothetical protein